MNEDQPQESLQPLTPATGNIPASIPSIYFNGFDVRISLGDVAVTLFRRGEPIAILESSFTVTKSLAEALGSLVARFEQSTGNKIMTITFIEEKLREVFDEGQPDD